MGKTKGVEGAVRKYHPICQHSSYATTNANVHSYSPGEIEQYFTIRVSGKSHTIRSYWLGWIFRQHISMTTIYGALWRGVQTGALEIPFSTWTWTEDLLYPVYTIHDTTGCQTGCTTLLTTGWMFVYTIQPVVRRLSNRIDNRLYRVNRVLYPVYTIQPVVIAVVQTAVVQPVVKPDWQPAASCKQTSNPVWQPCWTNSGCSFNTVVKPGCTIGLTTGCIHDTAGCETGCQTGLTTGLTTGCIV